MTKLSPEQGERVEQAFAEGRCVGCLAKPGLLQFGWVRCEECRSLVCRACRKKSLGPSHRVSPVALDFPWRCPGCGAGYSA